MKRRASSLRAQNLLGALLIAAVALALGAFAYAGLALRPPPTDPDTLCRTDQIAAAHTILFVDTTDRLEPRHRRKLRAVAAQERSRLAQYERFTLMRLNPRKPQEPTILFSKCLPLPPDRANPFVQNPRQAQENWDSAFANALDAALRSAQSSGPNRASPVLAGLRAIAADPDFGAEIPRRRLIVISDMLEHDPSGFSLYADGADYTSWLRRNGAPPPDLSQVVVRIVPIDRPDHSADQTRAMIAFWPAYFEASHAQTVSIDPAP